MVISATARVPNERLLGLLAVASAAALWAVAAAVASSLFDDGITPLELVQARAYITAAGLAVIPATWRRVSSTSRSRGRWGLIAAFGLAIALVNLTYYVAIDRIPVAVAIVLQYTAPAMVIAWASVASRRRPTSPILVALGGAIAGVILVSGVLDGGLGELDALGIAMGLGAALLFATYTLLSERLEDAYGPVPAIFRGFACASAFWIIVQIPGGWPSALLESEMLPRVLFVGVAGTLVPFLLYVWGVGRMRAARASIAATLEPVLAAVIAWAWLDQSLSPAQIAGGLLVVASVVMLQLRSATPVPPSDF